MSCRRQVASGRYTTPGIWYAQGGPGSRSVPELEAEVTKRRKELAEARMERDIVKKAAYCAGVAAKYAVMKTLRLEYPVTVLCRVFDVSRSGFYAWANGKPLQRAQEDARFKVAIEAVHAQSRQTYGPLRMQPELVAQGFAAGRDRIVRLRNALACWRWRQTDPLGWDSQPHNQQMQPVPDLKDCTWVS